MFINEKKQASSIQLIIVLSWYQSIPQNNFFSYILLQWSPPALNVISCPLKPLLILSPHIHHHKINLFLLSLSFCYPIFATLCPFVQTPSTSMKIPSFFNHQTSLPLLATLTYSLSYPTKFLSSPITGTTSETNHDHLHWLFCEQVFIILINATLSSYALAHVVGSLSSKALWFSLEKR